ncbi:MAG: hypothetical protein Q8R30_00710, partial [bacterium]|nr:hypothetical protein [bacterium]
TKYASRLELQTIQVSSGYLSVALLNLHGFRSKLKIFATKEIIEIGSNPFLCIFKNSRLGGINITNSLLVLFHTKTSPSSNE